ncbi:MAG TPA: molybdate ABC transporter substrate-binding protein [Candidatus Blautia merdavium]|uniref:Molybdate ABC transporter substrate-binding protein n=1 Tax=Candidatus Blautia merdavium TaxID=2838494 RepID=A0A9D2TBB1_9FIRM|nr:molybdate ABC transporter substrate-binding protein [Candidatus Blautia merdavium]
MKKRNLLIIGMMMAAMTLGAIGCGGTDGTETTDSSQETTASDETEPETEEADAEETDGEEAEPVNLLIAAAASLEYSMEDELIPMFEEQNPGITVEGTYDSSGKLQTQIEEGLDADVFFSAATKQMDALAEEGLVEESSVKDLLENKIVLIVLKGQEGNYSKFEDIANASTVALGDPASVPAGQYAQEALGNLGLWDAVSAKASFGTNVTEVLNWVAEGSADAGVVYATDAATKEDTVSVVAEAPADSLAEPVIYPVGLVENSTKKDAAEKFMEFLSSDDAAAVFEKYGFTVNQ